MTDIDGKRRHQGMDEYTAQQGDVRNPVLRPEETAIRKEIEEKAKLERILQNKIAHYSKKEQDKEEQKLQPQIGLPEMPEKEALQEQIQANQHQNQVFAGVKATERYRMGHMQEELVKARTEHGLELPAKQADQLVLEAGNNPTPGKEQQDVNKQLTREEKKWKDIFYDKNKTFPEKIAAFKEMISKIKIAGMKSRLTEKGQIKRGKKLMNEIELRKRHELRRLRNSRDLIARKMGRCA